MPSMGMSRDKRCLRYSTGLDFIDTQARRVKRRAECQRKFRQQPRKEAYKGRRSSTLPASNEARNESSLKAGI